jgi:hypothetical protein
MTQWRAFLIVLCVLTAPIAGSVSAQTFIWSGDLYSTGQRRSNTDTNPTLYTYVNGPYLRHVSIPLNADPVTKRINAVFYVREPNEILDPRRHWHGNIAFPHDNSSEHNLTVVAVIAPGERYWLVIPEGTVERWWEADQTP